MKILNYIVFYSNKILRVIGSIILATILLSISAGIVSRYVFGAPFSWTEELATFLMVNLGYIGGAIVTIEKKHIVADFLISKAPPKLQTAVSFLGKLLAIAVFTLICSSSQQLLARSAYKTAALGLSRNLFYVPLFSMSAFMIFVVLVDLLNAIFPGYDIQAATVREEDQLLMEEELKEAREEEKQIVDFIQQSAEAEKTNDSESPAFKKGDEK